MTSFNASTINTNTARITDAVVVEATSSKIRSFLYELVEGTSNYRSLHSLTEQVEHQYHGRFIIELIQNAHDALLSLNDSPRSPARIEIALKDEGEFGTLYVANDGKIFSESNFNSLSQLGQSDKNPQESIGNKGIGFRSVLEITDAPEIYSLSTPSHSQFDGFCFTFSPDVITRITLPLLALLEGDDRALFPFSDEPLVDWDARLLAKFRASAARSAAAKKISIHTWLTRELKYLSPYLLPFPTDNSQKSAFVTEFEQRGFSTLIRFPLKSSTTLALVREKLKEVDSSALLFLEKATSLVLDSGDQRRELLRHQITRSNSLLNGREVSISEDSGGRVRRYWVWARNLVLHASPEKIKTALQQLPGKWPELEEATISIAVRLGEEPEQGALSIFLPTLLGTGCATHINAPFFGDMSRTHIDFGTSDDQGSSSGAIYNRFLLSEAALLATSVIKDELVGHGPDEARAVVDLLAPWGADQNAAKRWQQLTASAARECGVDITTATWFLSDRGWKMLSDTLLISLAANPSILTPLILRQHATFAAYVEELESRRELIEALSDAHGIGAYPAENDLACTVESIALDLHKMPETDWNNFWLDLDDLFNGKFSALAGKRVLLGNDGQLHAGGSDECAIFFIPRQGASDDEEVENDGDVKEIPLTLRPFVAFLSENIQVYEEKNGSNGRPQQTRIRKLLLDSKLVSSFRREDILSNVLIARTPPLPAALTSPDAALCRDILLWALRLMAHLVDRGKGEKSLRLLKNLPAPCNGGWYPLAETSFGPGWFGARGDATQNYLSLVKSQETSEALKRLLLPSDDRRWGSNGNAHIQLLRLAGVFDGLRLISIDSDVWGSHFQANRYSFLIPQNPPPAYSAADWNEYRTFVRGSANPMYENGKYEIGRLYAFPGIDKYSELDENARAALMQVVLSSAGLWEDGWDSLFINRTEGNRDSIQVRAPLAFCLSRLPWLGLQDGDVTGWHRPADRWHVPSIELARGRKWQFAHLRPLSGELADRLDLNPRLAAVMHRLGTPYFNPETKSASTQLLDALVNAVVQNEVPNWDVFLGQIRSAWRGFEPNTNSAFPKMLLVQRGGARLTAESPNDENPVYLPDTTKSSLFTLKHFELPVIAIETDDAKRLADNFTAAYPGGVYRASALTPMPLVDDKPWEASTDDRLQDNADIEWIIPVLLTIAAYFGPQSHGTTSESFKKQIKAFRDARLSIVTKIEAGLFLDETPVAPPLPVPALWLNKSQTLLLSGGWESDAASLSEALSNILGREDLDVPIKLMLTTTGPQPESKDIIHALEQLNLSEGHYRDVREHWRGDLGQIMEMLVPLLTILRPDINVGEFVEIDTEDAMTAFLARFDDDTFNSKNIVQMARNSLDMFDFGSKSFSLFGEPVQLSKWNIALSLRDQQPLLNDDALATFKAHLAAAAQVLRSLLASLIARQQDIGAFNTLIEQINTLTCPDAFQTDYWEVSFNQAVSVAIPLFVQWGATTQEIEAVQRAVSSEDLVGRLAIAGVNVKLDPIQSARDNREQLRNALSRLQQIGLAWAIETDYPNPADWESRIDSYLEHLSTDIEVTAFTHTWDEGYVWSLLRKLPIDERSVAFWNAVTAATGIDDLIIQLGLSNDVLITAKTKLDVIREDARRRKKVVVVCGKEFDGSEDNLSGLWSHICSGLTATALSELPPVDLKKLSALENASPRVKFKTKDSEPSKKPKQKHQTQSMKDLIGLSGEIHAFRMLQHTYGASTVSSSSWVSEYSLKAYPDNQDAYDGYGCDFKVVLQNRTYYIEVKASEGDHESFTLGSSEIRLAMKLAKKSSSRRKEVFQILRVSNALTAAPSFQLLPNPYDQKYQSLFVIEEADARVRYRSKN